MGMLHEEGSDCSGGRPCLPPARWLAERRSPLRQADVIKQRQENRKQAAAAMRAIKGDHRRQGPDLGRRRAGGQAQDNSKRPSRSCSRPAPTRATPRRCRRCGATGRVSRPPARRRRRLRQARRRGGIGRHGGADRQPSRQPARHAAPATRSSAPSPSEPSIRHREEGDAARRLLFAEMPAAKGKAGRLGNDRPSGMPVAGVGLKAKLLGCGKGGFAWAAG